MSGLLAQTAVTARFKPGQSPLGHRWLLEDPEGNSLGATKRQYGGGLAKRALWRSVTATGMDSGNDIRADVLDVNKDVVVRLFSHQEGRDEKLVDVTTPDGTPIGTLSNVEGEGLRFLDPSGTVVATVAVEDPKAPAWELRDAGDAVIGILSREPAKRVAGPSLLDYATGFNTITDDARDFQATMLLGFAFSNTYSISLAELPDSEPLRTLAVLSPVLSGYCY